MTAYKTTSLFLTVATTHFLGINLWALPTVAHYGHHTDRFAPSSIPGVPVGDKVQVAAFLDSSDPVGSPLISVEAIQGDTTITLDYIGSHHTIFGGLHLYNKFIDFDPDLTGSWEIVPTDSTGTGPSGFTPAIVDPEFLPLVEDVTIRGTPQGTSVSWALPDFDGFDPDAMLVRVMDAISGGFIFESNILPAHTTSYAAPAGVFEVGRDYAYAIILGDLEGSYLENSSWAFSRPFRLTVEGDYNQNGTVDAADYTVWRDSLGGNALVNRGVGITGPVGTADFEVWKANFGQSLGTGNGETAAVPEPAALILLAAGALGFTARAKRVR